MSYLNEYWDVEFDGEWFSLHDYAYHVENIYGARTDVPSMRNSNITVYGRIGRLHQPKIADSRTLTLRGWVSDTRPNGTPYPGLPCGEGLNTNWRKIRRLLWREDGALFKLRRRWTDEAGVLRTAVALVEYSGGLELSSHVSEAGAWTCDLDLVDPYFYSDADTVVLEVDDTETIINAGDASTTHVTITLTGPLTSPVLTNATTGSVLSYTASVGSGETVVLDVEEFTAVSMPSGENRIGMVTRSGSHSWFPLTPGGNAVTLTGGAGYGSCSIAFKDAWL